VEMLMDMREVIMIWNIVITIVMAVVGFFIKEKFNEIQRLGILLNRTREEIARDSVTQAEIDKILDHIDQRFNKLEDKINQLIAR
jgi:archaellum component FlaC